MNIETWRKNPELTAWANLTFGSPNGKLFMAMLLSGNPKNNQQSTTSVTEASLALGAIYGYDRCMGLVESSSILSPPQSDLCESWGTTNAEPATKAK